MKTTFWKCPHHKFIVRFYKKDKEQFGEPVILSSEEIDALRDSGREFDYKDYDEFAKLIFGCLHPSCKAPSGSINLCQLPLNYTGRLEKCSK